MVINSSDPNIIQKIDTHSYIRFLMVLKTITTRNYSLICNIENCYICTKLMGVNLKIQLILKFSFCKIEFLYYRNLSSSTPVTLICDYNQSARIRLKIPVASGNLP